MGLDRLSVDQRHILDEQAQDALPLARLDGRIIPYPREVGGQGEQLFPRLRVNQQPLFLRLPLIMFLSFGQRAQLVVPLRFQAVGDKTVVGSTFM